LKQVNIDGTFIYSSVVACDYSQTDIQIYPNPNNGNFVICSTASTQSYKLHITDMTGRIVYSTFGLAIPERIEINHLVLSPGVYLIHFYPEEKEVAIQKMIIF
jgi:hypothetical protein